MDMAFTVVWGVALLAIMVLSGVLALALRRGGAARTVADGDGASDLLKDTLLFYYEQDSVRATASARFIVHIPGDAWDAGWRDDLLRLEVVAQSPDSVTLPPALGRASVLSVYDLAAYRMTEMGNDIEIAQFVAPIDLVVTSDRSDLRLGLVTQTHGAWALAPAAEISPYGFEGVELPAGQRWTAASVMRPGRVCLVCLPEE